MYTDVDAALLVIGVLSYADADSFLKSLTLGGVDESTSDASTKFWPGVSGIDPPSEGGNSGGERH